jgi:hypothetical protein
VRRKQNKCEVEGREKKLREKKLIKNVWNWWKGKSCAKGSYKTISTTASNSGRREKTLSSDGRASCECEKNIKKQNRIEWEEEENFN